MSNEGGFQMTYNDFRAEAVKAYEGRDRKTQVSASTKHVISGIVFSMYVSHQARNFKDAVYTLHYVDGKKVSKPMFKDHLSQLQASA